MEALPRNRSLLAAARRFGYELGVDVEDAGLVGGGSDANTTSMYTATLDGLGPIGDGSHRTDERIDTTRLPERTALLALLLVAPLDHPAIARSRRPATRTLPPVSTRVAVVGTDASGTNVEIVAAWRALGIEAVLADAAAAAATHRQGEIVLGRLDILPTMLSVEPGLLELLLLERRGFRVLNPAFALAAAHDKLLTARLLAYAGLPHPRTEHLRRPGDPISIEPPLVLKPRLGSWGLDVFRCDTWAEFRLRLDEIQTRPWFQRQGVLVQELVPPVGQDLRLLVAGGRLVGAVRRTAGPGEWRTNVSLGGTKSPTVPPPAARSLAIAAAAALRADLVSVDLLPCGDDYTVIELNGAADFNATYSLPGRDVFHAAASALGLLPRFTA
jgi:RimK family alpha-L-glutamate ligase